MGRASGRKRRHSYGGTGTGRGDARCSLPAAAREVYALVGTPPDLVADQDPLLPPHLMLRRTDECGGVLVFRSENQGCAV
ncbi:hypothetical protein K1Y78_06395 [Streptomyces sp. tea 10]|nr:hypothetical protein [Streptomyces sp. tea 10]